LDELVKLLMELQEGSLPPALVGLWWWCFVVHGIPSVSPWNDLNPRTPAQAASCTDAVPDSAAGQGSSRMAPLRHRLFLMGLLLGRNYRHDTEKSCQTQPHAVDLTRSQAITCSAYYHSPATEKSIKHARRAVCLLPLSSRVEKGLQDR
jgi:hypothetical protein